MELIDDYINGNIKNNRICLRKFHNNYKAINLGIFDFLCSNKKNRVGIFNRRIGKTTMLLNSALELCFYYKKNIIIASSNVATNRITQSHMYNIIKDAKLDIKFNFSNNVISTKTNKILFLNSYNINNLRGKSESIDYVFFDDFDNIHADTLELFIETIQSIVQNKTSFWFVGTNENKNFDIIEKKINNEIALYTNKQKRW